MKNKTIQLILLNAVISVFLFFILTHLFSTEKSENIVSKNINEENPANRPKSFGWNIQNTESVTPQRKCITNSDYLKFLGKLKKLDNELFEEFGRIDELEGHLYEQLSENDKTKYKDRLSREWLANGKNEAKEQMKESLNELGEETIKEIQKHSMKAQDFMKQGKYRDAIEAAKEAISLAPDNALTGFNYLQMADCYSKAGNYSEAYDIADLIMDKYPDSRIPDGQLVSANARFIIADICKKEGNSNCVEKMRYEIQERYSDATFGNGKNILQVMNNL